MSCHSLSLTRCRRLHITVLALGLISIGVGCGTKLFGSSADSTPAAIAFEDPDIEAAVRAELDQPSGPLTTAQVATVKSLDLGGKRVLSLAGLEHCTGLTSLDLSENFYVPRSSCGTGWSPELDNVDLKPLSGLTKLRTLDLHFNDIGDIAALAGMTRLEELDLSGNSVNDLRPLSGLSRLKKLKLQTGWGEEVQWEAMSKLTSLETLEVGGGGAEVLTALASCRKLTDLSMWGFDYEDQDISAIGGLKALKKLNLRMTDRRNIDGLEGCLNLEELDLSDNQIDDLTPLASLTRLKDLKLDGNCFRDLTPLAGCRNLKRLSMQYLHDDRANYDSSAEPPALLADLSPLAGLPTLEELALDILVDGTPLTPLVSCPSLTKLTVAIKTTGDLSTLATIPTLESLATWVATPIDLSPIQRAPKLSHFRFAGPAAQSLRALAAVQLKSLDLRCTGAGFDLNDLAAMPTLKSIDLSWEEGNWDLAPLAAIPSLRKVSMGGGSSQQWSGLDTCDQVTEVQVPFWYGDFQFANLRGMAGLTTLGLSAGGTFDLTILSESPQLESLTLESVTISDLTPLLALTELKTVKLDGASVLQEQHETLLAQLRDRGVTVSANGLSLMTPAEVAEREEPFPDPMGSFDWKSVIGGGGDPELLPEAPPGIPSTPVEIPDQVLREELVSLLGVETPTQADLARLVSAQFYKAGVTNLTGLEYAINLEYLRLSDHDRLHDISPLAGLPKLKSLNLENSKVADLAPLANCPELQELNLGSYTDYQNENAATGLPDLAPLGQVKKLRRLDVSYSGVLTLVGLKDCRALEVLELGTNPRINDVRPLAGLTRLRVLDLSDTGVADIAPLAGLTDLEELSMSFRQSNSGIQMWSGGQGVIDIVPLAKMSKLRKLKVSMSSIPSAAPLAGLSNLEEVELDMCDLQSLEGLAGHPKLKRLNIGGNPLTSYAGLKDLPALEYLDCERNDGVTSLAGIEQVPSLKELNLDMGNIRDFGQLAGLPNLEKLDIGGNPGVELGPLATMTSLKDLELSNMGYKEPWGDSPTNGRPGELIRDLTPLSRLVNLERLYLYGGAVTDLSPLKGLPRLSSVALYHNQVSDLSPLVDGAGFPEGGSLELEGNPLSFQAKKTQIAALEARGVDVMY